MQDTIAKDRIPFRNDKARKAHRKAGAIFYSE